MRESPHLALSPFGTLGKRRLACAVLLGYLAVLLQPCAMAMGHAPAGHHGSCHDDSLHLDGESCLSQPTSECATDDSILDNHDPWSQQFDAQLVSLIPSPRVDCVAGSVAESRYFSRAPPPDGPGLNVRHCVFLK